VHLQSDINNALAGLGFSAFESEVLLALQGLGVCTAYAVAKSAGLNKANTYKALESLSRKGAVDLVDDEERHWRAVPAEELLAQAGRRHQEAMSRARSAMLPRDGLPRDHRVFRLASASAVFERAGALIRRASAVVAVDAFPTPLGLIASELSTAAERGCALSVRCYAPTEIPGAHIFLAPDYQRVVDDWSGEWLTVAVDGMATLIAFFAPGGEAVRDAFVTENPLLSMVLHNGVIGESLFGDLVRRIRGGEEAQVVADDLIAISREVEPSTLPGRSTLRGADADEVAPAELD